MLRNCFHLKFFLYVFNFLMGVFKKHNTEQFTQMVYIELLFISGRVGLHKSAPLQAFNPPARRCQSADSLSALQRLF